jgi:hypothetical protein
MFDETFLLFTFVFASLFFRFVVIVIWAARDALCVSYTSSSHRLILSGFVFLAESKGTGAHRSPVGLSYLLRILEPSSVVHTVSLQVLPLIGLEMRPSMHESRGNDATTMLLSWYAILWRRLGRCSAVFTARLGLLPPRRSPLAGHECGVSSQFLHDFQPVYLAPVTSYA